MACVAKYREQAAWLCGIDHAMAMWPCTQPRGLWSWGWWRETTPRLDGARPQGPGGRCGDGRIDGVWANGAADDVSECDPRRAATREERGGDGSGGRSWEGRRDWLSESETL